MSSGSSRGLGDSLLELKQTTALVSSYLVDVLFPHRYDIDLVHPLLIYAPHRSYPCSLGLMGSTSHLANEFGNEDRDRNTTDGRIISRVIEV